jgi:hypothetical protein
MGRQGEANYHFYAMVHDCGALIIETSILSVSS